MIDFLQYGFELSSLGCNFSPISRRIIGSDKTKTNYKENDNIPKEISNIIASSIGKVITKYGFQNTYLLLSSGKDSLFILYTLDKMGLADKINYITLEDMILVLMKALLCKRILSNYNKKTIKYFLIRYPT